MKRMSVVVLIAAIAGCAAPAPKEMNPAQRSPAETPTAATPDAPSEPVAAAPESTPAPAEPPAASSAQADTDEFREVFPHVRFNATSKAVAFDGVVPIDAHDEASPWVFLEVVVCTPDTKEHEALVMTEAKPSHVHAALLLAGLTPGKPGRWDFADGKLIPIPPEGDQVRVTLSYTGADGSMKALTPQEMIVHAQTGKRFGEARAGKWLFAGSQIVTRAGREWYDADGAGTLVGLTTFGSETIAWSEMISHEAGIEEPVWIADKRTTPRAGTPITVTIRKAE